MSRLAELQKTFHDSILSRDMHSIVPFLEECDKLPSDERLSVYRSNYYVLLTDVMSETFSRVRTLVGDDYFKQVVYAFLAKYPPTTGCLFDYGNEFPDFLDTLPTAKDLPYLSDIARLEWIMNQAYYAQDSSPFSQKQLAEISEENLPKLRFEYPPSTHFLQSPFPLKKIWELANGEHNNTVDLKEGAAYALVIRPIQEVQIYWLMEEVYVFLKKVYQGETLENAYQAASKINEKFGLQHMLQTCFAQKFFTSFRLKK